jgi:hypothetical protein
MNRLDIIRMAHEAGFMAAGHPMNPWSAHTDQIEAFAALVAEHEREECAKVCDVLATHPEYASQVTKLAAMAIRARGEK